MGSPTSVPVDTDLTADAELPVVGSGQRYHRYLYFVGGVYGILLYRVWQKRYKMFTEHRYTYNYHLGS